MSEPRTFKDMQPALLELARPLLEKAELINSLKEIIQVQINQRDEAKALVVPAKKHLDDLLKESHAMMVKYDALNGRIETAQTELTAIEEVYAGYDGRLWNNQQRLDKLLNGGG